MPLRSASPASVDEPHHHQQQQQQQQQQQFEQQQQQHFSTLPSRSSTSTSRRTPLAFLRKTKSGEAVRKMPLVSPTAPRIPDFDSPAPLTRDVADSVDIFSASTTPSNASSKSQQPAMPNFVPGRKSTDSVMGRDGEYVGSSSVGLDEDPYASVGSMAHRGRFSYASTAVGTVNSPRRIRRRKDPTPFNVLVIGAKNSGKTSFCRFLRQSLASKKRGQNAKEPVKTDHSVATPITTIPDSGFRSSYLETEIEGERIGLTIWDSAGLEKNVVDLQLRETVAFIEAKFEETFSEETKVVRAPGVRDTHIHCVFLLLDPARLTPGNHYPGKMGSKDDVGGLDPDLDISVFKGLHGKTLVIPVISKSDTCTGKHMEILKDVVRKGLASANEDPLESLELGLAGDEDAMLESDEDDTENSSGEEGSTRAESVITGLTAGLNFIPLSIISPDSYEPDEPVGRHFPWGFADPYNEKHCDFARLKDSVFGEWRAELREKSREYWYENWRSDRLGNRNRRRY